MGRLGLSQACWRPTRVRTVWLGSFPTKPVAETQADEPRLAIWTGPAATLTGADSPQLCRWPDASGTVGDARTVTAPGRRPPPEAGVPHASAAPAVPLRRGDSRPSRPGPEPAQRSGQRRPQARARARVPASSFLDDSRLREAARKEGPQGDTGVLAALPSSEGRGGSRQDGPALKPGRDLEPGTSPHWAAHSTAPIQAGEGGLGGCRVPGHQALASPVPAPCPSASRGARGPGGWGGKVRRPRTAIRALRSDFPAVDRRARKPRALWLTHGGAAGAGRPHGRGRPPPGPPPEAGV